ncbi:MAG: choice-of-anchor D domain-containing protein [Ignavibacteria bacterium]|nr:choice-of-anchor D domain-containing protein [Ignavibacteria bacterium]
MVTAVCIVVCFLLSNEVWGQSFVVVGTDAKSYPTVVSRAYAFAFSWAPQPITEGSIALKHNGSPLAVTVGQEPSTNERAVSLMVLADMSSSVSGGTPSTFEIIKGAAQQAPSLLNQSTDEIALGMFDANPTLLHGLTTDKTLYVSSLAYLKAGSGTDLNKGLNSQPMGGLVHLQTARNPRALLLIVDGAPSFNVAASLQLVKSFRTEVYIIGVRTGLTPELKKLADSSGGLWVENVASSADANAYALGFVSQAKRLAASTLEYVPADLCIRSHVAEFTYNSVVRTELYSVPSYNISALEWSVSGIDFGTTGVPAQTTVRLTARGAPVTIQSVAKSDPVFTLNPTIEPGTVLQQDQSIDLTVAFAGAATIHFGTFTITSNGCEVTPLYVRGGLSPQGQTIKVLKPNGGESFVAGLDTLIEWTNTLPADPVRIEMSSDAGTTWSTITENAQGNSYRWTAGPTTSDNSIIRVQHTLIDSSNIVVLRGHVNSVYSAAFDRSAQRVVTGGNDGTVRVWNSVTGVEERQLGTHQGWVWAVATHPRLDVAASGGFDGTVRVWDMNTGERIITIKTDGRVWSLDFSPTRNHLAIGIERSLMIVNTSDWTTVNIIAAPDGPVYSCRYSLNDEILVTGEGSKVVVRDANTWEVRQTLTGHVGPVYAVAASPDAQSVYSGGADFIVRKWDAATGTELSETSSAISAILALDITSDGTRLLLGEGDGSAKLLDASSMTLSSTLAGHQGSVYASRFNLNGSRIVTASSDETARVWNVSGLVMAQDVSDAAFRVIGGNAGVTDIKHGDVVVGFGNDVSSSVITNTGSDPLVIKSARLVSGDVDEFSLLTAVPQTILNASNSLVLETTFTPQVFADRAASIQVVTGTGTKQVGISGIGILSKISFPSVVDFGRQLANQAVVDTTIYINAPASAGTITVTRTLLLGEQSSEFSLESGGGTFTVSSTNPRQLLLRFTPSTFGRFAAWIEFTLGDGSISTLRLYGEGAGDARISSSDQSILFSSDRCNAVPVTDSVTFLNTGTSTLQLYAASIAGEDASEFEIIEPQTFPLSLDAQEKNTFIIRFSPAESGIKDARLVVSSNAVDAAGGITIIPFVARKDSVAFELSKSSVIFDNVNEGNSAVQSIQIINTGTTSLRWAPTPIELGDFRIESVEPNTTMPNAQSEVVIKFKGGIVGQNYSASYVFVDSICQRSARLDISATVKSYIGLTLSIDTVMGSIGKDVTVPIRISDKVNFDRTQVSEIQARLRVNGTILTPSGSGDRGTFGTDGSRVFDVTIPIPQSGDIALALPFTVTWGNDTASAIEIDSVWTNDTLTFKTKNGMVLIDNICFQGGPRLLVRPSQGPARLRVIPQPASDNAVIELIVIESGLTTVDLFDVSGRMVKQIVQRNLSPGMYFIPFDTTTLEAGAYTIHLTTPTQQISQQLSVVR